MEGLMLKLKLQYFGHLMRRADSLEKTQMLGKIEGERRRGRQDEMVGWHHQLNCFVFEEALGDGKAFVLQSTGSEGVRHNLATEQQIKKISINPS